jgi:Flp pilus assembly protein TadG
MQVMNHRRRQSRQAAITVELALCLPLLVLLTFGSIQACNAINLKQALTCAAYEGTRIVGKPTGTRDDAEAAIQQILDARNITGATISWSPDLDFVDIPPGDLVTVTVRAPVSANLPRPAIFTLGIEFECNAVCTR